MQLSERILEAMGERSKADFARAIGVSNSAVTFWLNGETKSLKAQVAQKMEAVTGRRADWIINGRLPKQVAGATNIAPAAIGTTRIPLIDYVQAGMWTAVADTFEPGDADDWLLTDLELSVNAFALQIKGDSMEPEFGQGDRVIIDPDVTPQAGDYVVAKNGGDEATFKKYRVRGQNDGGQIVFELIPLNEDYAPMRSDQQPIQIVGTMVEHRKYRKRR